MRRRRAYQCNGHHLIMGLATKLTSAARESPTNYINRPTALVLRSHTRVIERSRFCRGQRLGDRVGLEVFDRADEIIDEHSGHVAAEAVPHENSLHDEILAIRG